MKSRAESKERLMGIAEAEIEKLLDWMEATAPDLAGIEKVVGEIRKRISEGMSEEVIEGQEAVRPVPGPACPKCKEEMHYKGIKKKEITSLSGEIELKRGYYYCDHCRALRAPGLFPLDRQLGVVERNWSENVIQEMNWLSGVADSYERAEEIMKRIGQIEMSDSTIWGHVQVRGAALQEAEEKRKEKAMALPKVGERPRQPARGADCMGVGMDGGMVNMREEGWKEFKVGTVFKSVKRLTRLPESEEWVELAHAERSSYVAHLGDAQAFGPLIWREAQARGWEEARTTQTIGDGAHWIWNIADEHFPLSVRTVDWYHASQYLHEVAQLLFPDAGTAATRWYNRTETLLFQGQGRSHRRFDHRQNDRQPGSQPRRPRRQLCLFP